MFTFLSNLLTFFSYLFTFVSCLFPSFKVFVNICQLFIFLWIVCLHLQLFVVIFIYNIVTCLFTIWSATCILLSFVSCLFTFWFFHESNMLSRSKTQRIKILKFTSKLGFFLTCFEGQLRFSKQITAVPDKNHQIIKKPKSYFWHYRGH